MNQILINRKENKLRILLIVSIMKSNSEGCLVLGNEWGFYVSMEEIESNFNPKTTTTMSKGKTKTNRICCLFNPKPKPIKVKDSVVDLEINIENYSIIIQQRKNAIDNLNGVINGVLCIITIIFVLIFVRF